MPTKYDVFAKLIEKSPCKIKDLDFENQVYSHIKSLTSMGWVKKVNKKYIPIKNKKTQLAFSIIKFSLNHGLDYNIFFSKNLSEIIEELIKNTPYLRPKKLKGNRRNIEILNYLENNQFILLNNLRPKEGILLRHELLENVLKFNDKTIDIQNNYLDISDEVLNIDVDPINPYDKHIFSFLSGSAQLEGSTVTEGETRDIILKDIYPDKPKKEVQMVKNLNEAMHYIFNNLDKEISENDIKKINELVLFSHHRNAGNYKKNNNRIQGNPSFKTARPIKVPLFIENYLEEINSISSRKECLSKLGFIHNELQRIHPFSDGNSRTTRMVLNWMLLKFNLPFLVIKMGAFDTYMNLTKLSDKRDDNKLKRLFEHLMLHEYLIN